LISHSGNVFVLSAPSGTGKSTLAKRLVEDFSAVERLAGAGKTLVAGRIAQTGAWTVDGPHRDVGAGRPIQVEGERRIIKARLLGQHEVRERPEPPAHAIEVGLCVGELQALLGAGAEFEGTLVFQGRIRIEGRFKGEIRSDEVLILGPSAEVQANIHVGALIVRGGVLRGSGRLPRARRRVLRPGGLRPAHRHLLR